MKKKLITGLLILTMVISVLSLNVNATDTTVTLTPSKTEVKPGDTFTVTVSASCEDGINGLTGTINYGESLELVKVEVADNNWSNFGQDTEIAITGNSLDTIKAANIVIITFKVKNNSQTGTSASISLLETMLDSDAAQDSEHNLGTKGTSVSIVSASADEDTNTNSNTNTNTNANSNTSTNTNTNSVKVTGSTQTTAKTLPSTGTSIIVIGIVGFVGAAAVVAYVSYRRYKNI